MAKGSDTKPKASESHESGKKGEPVRNGGNQMQRFVRNGVQANNHTFRRKTKSHPQRREKKRKKPPKRRECQLSKLPIQSGFKGIQR